MKQYEGYNSSSSVKSLGLIVILIVFIVGMMTC